MSLPAILLVDDSESVLAYESAALGRDYSLRTATNGRIALEAMRAERPDLVLLDLSMPVCNGDEVLAQMRADPALAEVPVIIVTTERQRALACVSAGANAYLPKPIRADDLRAVVSRMLAATRSSIEAFDLRALMLRVGGHALAIPLRTVRHVVLRPATEPLLFVADVSIETFDFHGERVAVIDLEQRLGLTSASAPEDRWVVILAGPSPSLGLLVDQVDGPERFSRALVETSTPSREDPGLFLGVPCLAHVRCGALRIPIIDPEVAVPDGLRSLASEALGSFAAREAAPVEAS